MSTKARAVAEAASKLLDRVGRIRFRIWGIAYSIRRRVRLLLADEAAPPHSVPGLCKPSCRAAEPRFWRVRHTILPKCFAFGRTGQTPRRRSEGEQYPHRMQHPYCDHLNNCPDYWQTVAGYFGQAMLLRLGWQPMRVELKTLRGVSAEHSLRPSRWLQIAPAPLGDEWALLPECASEMPCTTSLQACVIAFKERQIRAAQHRKRSTTSLSNN